MERTVSTASERPQRLGRPRKSPDELRTEELRLYLSLPEKQRLDDDAFEAGLRPAEYVRQLILGHRPASIAGKSHSNPRLLLELNAIGNNLNQAVRDLHMDTRRSHDWDEVRKLLADVLERVALDVR